MTTRPRQRFWLVPLLALACTALFVLQFRGIPRPLTVAANVQTEHCARLRLLFDVLPNAGIAEAIVRSVDSRLGFQTVRFPINATAVRNIRLLVEPGSGKVHLANVRIERFGGGTTAPRRLLAHQETVKSRPGLVTINATKTNAGVSLQLEESARASSFARFLRIGILIALSLLCLAVV